MSPLQHLDPFNGDVVYTETLLAGPPEGVTYVTYDDALHSGEIIEHLTAVKGIGQWSAHMLLIFTLHRLDILPVGDLAIRKGFQSAYKLDKMPNAKEMEALAKDWRAHASVASWYLWRVADEDKS